MCRYAGHTHPGDFSAGATYERELVNVVVKQSLGSLFYVLNVDKNT